MFIPVIFICGLSGSGKTTIACGLVAEFKKRGMKVATVKHCAHGFEMDRQGKDSCKHNQAGAELVLVSSPYEMAVMKKHRKEPSPQELVNIIQGLADIDMVVIEGYKKSIGPKIEVLPMDNEYDDNQPPAAGVIAMAGCTNREYPVPVFDREDFAGLADFVIERVSGKAEGK